MIIKSIKKLLQNISAESRQRRDILLKIANYVLEEITPKKLFKSELSKIKTEDYKKVIIISMGKAAKEMVSAVIPLLDRLPDKVLFADEGHPLPTIIGMKKTEEIIKESRELGEDDLAIVLISGGASAMFVKPTNGISLDEKIKLTKDLLKCGATINEINIIRKHISDVKGGRLAAMLFPATVMGFVISDVVGNDLSTIASGPISPDTSTFADAINIIKKYKINAPKGIIQQLETPKPDEKYFKKVTIKIVSDHSTVIKKAEFKANEIGLKTEILPGFVIGEAREVAATIVKNAPKNCLLIGCGETTVTCRGDGSGGRNQEFALSALKHLSGGQTLLSIGTDGVDGICPEPIAGVIVDNEIFSQSKEQNLSIEDYLNRNDSYNFFKKAGGHIITEPTGTNLGDLILLLS